MNSHFDDKTRRFIVWASLSPFLLISILFIGFLFWQIDKWGREYDIKTAKIQSGQVQSEQLDVVAAYGPGDPCIVYKGIYNPEIMTEVTTDYFKSPSVKLPVIGYYFPDGYFIPVHHTGGHHKAKWVFLAFGIIFVSLIVFMGWIGTRNKARTT